MNNIFRATFVVGVSVKYARPLTKLCIIRHEVRRNTAELSCHVMRFFPLLVKV